MTLYEICTNIALKALGKPGTIIECMVQSNFNENLYGLVGKFYEVTDTEDESIVLRETGVGVIPNRFRLVSEGNLCHHH